VITFRLARHSGRDVEVVEILDGNRLLGALYPQAHGVELISKYLKEGSVVFLKGPPGVLCGVLEIKLP
jgi:hypothetical protein